MNAKMFFLFTSTFFILVSCSHSEKKSEVASSQITPRPEASVEAKQVAAQEQAPVVAEMSFEKGKANLLKTNQNLLIQTLQRAQKSGKIEAVEIVAWADMEYPSVHTKKLPTQQRTLAADRLKTLKDFILQNEPGTTIREYDMSQRPTPLGSVFATSDARVKRALEVSGIPNTDSSVKVPSKASKAMVLMIIKE